MSGRRAGRAAGPHVEPPAAASLDSARHRNGSGDGLVEIAAEAILRQLPMGVLVAGADGHIALANVRAAEMIGTPPGGLATTDEYARLRWFLPDGTPLDPQEWPLSRALARGEAVVDEEVTVVRPDGVPVVVRASATPLRDGQAGIAGAMAILADFTAERQAREVRTYLAEAGSLLGGTLEVGEAAGALARLAVPRIADWCSVEILEADGSLRQAGLAHSDPEHLELARELRDRQPPHPSDPTGLHAVIRGREPVLIPEIPPEAIEDPRLDEHEREIVRSLGLQSLLMIPLVAGDVPIGALNLVTAGSGRRLRPEDLALAEALGSRAAAAIHNARLVEDLRRFKAVLDATHEGIVIVDGPSHRVEYANHAAGALFGDDQASLVGRPIETLASAGRRALRAAFTAVAAHPGTGRRVTLRVGPPGAGRPVELSLQALTTSQADRVVGIARDVGERIEAAERMRRLVVGQRAHAAELDAVIRAIGDGLVVVASDGRIRLANPAAERLLPGLEDRTWAELVAQLEGGRDRLPDCPGGCAGVELRRAGPDECWIEVSCYPVARPRTASDGGGSIVVLRDVTEAHRRQLLRDTFLGVLSHELRTPVTTIYGAAKVLARDGGRRSNRHDELFDDIADESERLQRLVENVIALQRFGEDGGDIGREPVLLQHILPAAVEAERSRWPGVEFALEMDSGLPTVVADPVYLEQVVRNLLGNAAKYAGPGGPVRVTTQPAGDEVIVRVLDRGPGIAADESARLFELYYRSPATAAQAAGAGIGLFVCARLISAMGGRIWGRPRDGGGAEFGFALRVMDDD